MRYLRKALRVVNRFPDEQKSKTAMEKVRAGYVKKMEEKGWELFGAHEYEGNHFMVWELILRMRKPNKRELAQRKKLTKSL